MVILRRGTFDRSIWTAIEREYPDLPASFAAGEILLDVGCHTGALCYLAAQRGATVVGYEASFENYALAVINLKSMSSVSLHHAAVWRSDVRQAARLRFSPSADRGNTGGGSVLFATPEDHSRAAPPELSYGPRSSAVSPQEIGAVALDEILAGLGPVRVLKLDVEGAEFPILLTAERLDLVTMIVGEYHEFTDAAMALMAPGARVGTERYTADLLRRRLTDVGFAQVRLMPSIRGRGIFAARRASSPT